ncbi:hypothetical protein F5888DRAFT_1693099 [Russula emetica]|nr:hypothetical protein F5888DRAFT_1693099 [Russula emetica]
MDTTGRLRRLLKTTPSDPRSKADSKGKSPMVSPESAPGDRRPILNIDTRPSFTVGTRQSYGAIGERQSIGGSLLKCKNNIEICRNGHPLFDVPEEAEDGDLEALLEEQGLYLGSYRRLVRDYTIVPITSLLVWFLFALVPLLVRTEDSPKTLPHAPCFPTPLPELLLSISLFTLSHILSPYLFALADMLLPHPTATSALGSALHIILRNVLRTAAFPILALATPGGAATFYAPAFGRVWWLALGWSLAEVTAGVVQGYKTIALYRDVLVPGSEARELVASAVAVTPGALKNGGSDSSRLRESLSRGEDGGPAVEVAESPVRSREQQQQCVPVFVSCLLRVASILLSLGIVLLLSAGYLTSPFAWPPIAEYGVMTTIPPSQSNDIFWGTFFGVCGVNWGLSMLHTPALLSRVGVHVVAYLGFLVGLGMLFTGLSVWDALS